MKRIYLIMVVMTMMSCVSEVEKATVETRKVIDVTSNSAKVVCNVSDDGGAEVSLRGVCWDTICNPVIATASSMGAGSGIGNYECDIDGLNSNTTYYVRAYATNSAGVSYGEEVSFNTLDGNDGDDSGSDSEIAGHEYVDLGLPSGLKWATCNVGAEKPEDYGDYFAWGEIETKSEYTESNSLTHGKQMDDISGDVQYDVAAANWGGSWRMPTKDEMIELVSNCEWEWILIEKNDYDSVKCYKGIGPNGNSVIFPVAGCYNGPSLISVGTGGLCWTSTPYDVMLNLAYEFYFNDYNAEVSYIGNRFIGQSVRPVSE
ncbi:MAG: hypothetical protein IJ961_04130 [Bacteroidales bacterium]|nr:hypothetical protein [Bacteroidales bacterium]